MSTVVAHNLVGMDHSGLYHGATNSTHFRGQPIRQFFHHFPAVEWTYFDFEKNYDPTYVMDAMRDSNYFIPVFCCVAYLVFCYYGKVYMRNLKPFDLRTPLALWNLGLSVFSTYGMLRTAPHMIYRISTLPFEDTICQRGFTSFGSGAVGLACQLFVLSKIPELVDTVFIVLRKKPLIFLHWYHHVTVLISCWNAYVTESSVGLYAVAMNYSVHSIMYFYYFLHALKAVPKGFPAYIITILQIAQMMVGTFVVGCSMYYHVYGGSIYGPGECNNDPSLLVIGGIIYSSYFYLFVEFAILRYVITPTPMTKGKSLHVILLERALGPLVLKTEKENPSCLQRLLRPFFQTSSPESGVGSNGALKAASAV